MTKSSQHKCQNCICFLESTYPEMQRKHIPRLLEYMNNIRELEKGFQKKTIVAFTNSTVFILDCNI